MKAMFLDVEQKKMLNYVVEYVAQKAKVDEKCARKMVDESPFIHLLKEQPEYVSHDGVEYWGNIIIEKDFVN